MQNLRMFNLVSYKIAIDLKSTYTTSPAFNAAIDTPRHNPS